MCINCWSHNNNLLSFINMMIIFYQISLATWVLPTLASHKMNSTQQWHTIATNVNHHSIIGKMNCHAQNTLPNITYAVNSCTQFFTTWTNCPFQLSSWFLDNLPLTHRTKAWYLILPMKTALAPMSIASLWVFSQKKLCTTVFNLSCTTGFCYYIFQIPHPLVSKLQTSVWNCVSTWEAAYIALSLCMHTLLPIWHWWPHKMTSWIQPSITAS